MKRQYYQNRRMSKKKKKQQQQNSHNNNTRNNINDDIMEQLRLQRLNAKINTTAEVESKTSQHYEQSTILVSSNPRSVDTQQQLGNYTYDTTRRAYFPTNSKEVAGNIDLTLKCDASLIGINDRSNQASTGCCAIPHRMNRLLHIGQQQPQRFSLWTPPTLTYTLELLHGSKPRRNLISNWYSTKLCNSMSIRPIPKHRYECLHPIAVSSHQFLNNAITTATTSNNAFANTGYIANNDNNTGSALWTRTFDVEPPSRHRNQNNNNNNNRANSNNDEDDQRTDTGSSMVKFYMYHHPFVHGKILNHCWEGGTSTGSHDAPEYVPVVGVLQPLRLRNTLFHLFGSHTDESIMTYECNDMTAPLNHQKFDFIYMGGNGSRCSTYDVRRMMQIENFVIESNDNKSRAIASDIFCVESDQSGTRPNLILYGHRSGTIQIRDTRTNHIVGKCMNDNTADSVLRIQPLFRERPDQLLSRGRNAWTLYDLRRMGTSGGDGIVSGTSNATVIYNVSLRSTSNPTSIPCKGMATDPMQSTAIIPFQQLDSNSNNAYGVKMWSLDSGSYVGCNKIHNASAENDSFSSDIDLHPSDIELCSTITRAWSSFHPTSIASNDRTIPATTTTTARSKFGLWLKLGQSGMYHITGG